MTAENGAGVEQAGVAGPLCVLIGAPGAGKTKIGRLLASQLDVEFRDTDHDIEHEAGKSVSDIFVTDGEPAFRELEAAAVARALQEHRGVLSLGGGAVINPATRELLAGQRVVWLKVGLAAAAKRTGVSSTPRPLLMGNLRGTLKSLLDARDPVYAEVASLTVDADVDDLPGKAAQITEWLGSMGLPPQPQGVEPE